MICYSLRNCDDTYCKFMLETRRGCAVEVRLDSPELTIGQIQDIFSYQRQATAVASFLKNGDIDLSEAVERLSAAIIAGCDIVDIGLWLPEDKRRWLITLALNRGCRIILSHHDFSCTPEVEALSAMVRKAFAEGADMVKIATTARTPDDPARVLSLYDTFGAGSLIAFAMGEMGRESRLDSFRRGAPLFYVALRRGSETAPGQYCNFDFIKREGLQFSGRVTLPPSKSIAQRAILLASLTEGPTKLFGFQPCADSEAALRVASFFGAEIRLEGTTLTIIGHQDIQGRGLRIEGDVVDVGDSALLARMCIPICALAGRPVIITGGVSLFERKICECRSALSKFGIKVECRDRSHLPLLVSGRLHSGEGIFNGAHGSQIISGLLIALSQCAQDSFLLVRGVTSRPYLDLTSQIGNFFNLANPSFPEEEDDADRTYIIDGSQTIRPVVGMALERDWSAAAYFLAAGAIAGDVTVEGLDIKSVQGDASMFDFMEQCNIDFEVRGDGAINVRRSIICPFSFDLTDTPDLIGPVILLALRADGESCISGLKRLRNKESDRAATFVEEFTRIGADMFVARDGCLYIEGSSTLQLRGGRCSSHGDHRLAMALAVASSLCRHPLSIDDVQCIGKSFPGFIETLEKIRKPVQK